MGGRNVSLTMKVPASGTLFLIAAAVSAKEISRDRQWFNSYDYGTGDGYGYGTTDYGYGTGYGYGYNTGYGYGYYPGYGYRTGYIWDWLRLRDWVRLWILLWVWLWILSWLWLWNWLWIWDWLRLRNWVRLWILPWLRLRPPLNYCNFPTPFHSDQNCRFQYHELILHSSAKIPRPGFSLSTAKLIRYRSLRQQDKDQTEIFDY